LGRRDAGEKGALGKRGEIKVKGKGKMWQLGGKGLNERKFNYASGNKRGTTRRKEEEQGI